MEQKILKYNALFRKEPEGGYTVTILSLPGCITYGKNLDEAKRMTFDAIWRLYSKFKKTWRTDTER